MADQYVPQGIPFLRSQNIRPGRLDLAGLKHISMEFHDRLKKSQLRAGDIVIVRTGEPGAAAVIPDDTGPLNCADLVIARPGPTVDPWYVCYAINTTARKHVAAHLVGAVQQHFNVGSAKTMPLALPPIDAQRAITDVLRALDDKIAANYRVAETAETLAVAIIQTASKRSPLHRLATLKREQVSPAEIRASLVDHYSIPAFDARRLPEAVPPSSVKSAKFVVPPGSVLLSKLNPGIPRVWNARPSGARPAIASTEFLVLLPGENITNAELWAACNQTAFIEALASKVTGTSNSHQRARPSDILASEVLDPRSLPDASRRQIGALADRVAVARSESESLEEARDTLLPRLMSGEIRVREAEKAVEEVL